MRRAPPAPEPVEVDAARVGSLAQTRGALRAYDAAVQRLSAARRAWRHRRVGEGGIERVAGLLLEVERLEVVVGLSFAGEVGADVPGAELVRPSPWLRRLCRRAAKASGVRAVGGAVALFSLCDGEEIAPFPSTPEYEALRARAEAAASERLEPIGAEVVAAVREHERDDCEHYEECLDRAAARNDRCLPCGRTERRRRGRVTPGCPLLDELRARRRVGS